MRRCTGLRSRLSYFSITGWDFTHLAQGYAARANSHKVEVAGASHCVYISHPKEVAALIEGAATHARY
jgi:pimeloyl-ACP methyl ester carboxylesterase